jgi:antitoxin (DNA-binding transcriptional repressor) of toxin-antitoxin stability system
MSADRWLYRSTEVPLDVSQVSYVGDMKSVTKSELHRQTAKVLAAVDAEGPVVVTERGLPRWRIDAIAAAAESDPDEVIEGRRSSGSLTTGS